MSKVVLGLMLAVLVFLAGYWFRGFLDVDRCLDLGGAWDYERDHCVTDSDKTGE